MHYFDYAATTPVDQEVLDTFIQVTNKYWGNSESLHHFGNLAKSVLNKSSDVIKDTLKLKNHKIIYLENATTANNLVIKGVKGSHYLTTKIEHASNDEIYTELEKRGSKVSYLKINKNGQIDINDLKEKITKDTVLISLTSVNNITGTILNINEILDVLKNYSRTKIHLDMVQHIGKIPINFDLNKIDFITFSGHKIYSIKGIGALIYKDKSSIEPLIIGAMQQNKLHSGTVNVPGIASLAKAIKKVDSNLITNYQKVSELNDYLINELEKIKGLYVNIKLNKSPFITSISIPSIRPETVVNALSQVKIYISTRSACSSSKDIERERVLYYMGCSDEISKHSLRISLSHLVNKDSINILVKELINIIKTL